MRKPKEQPLTTDHDAYLAGKVAAARASIAAGFGRLNAEVEANFVARRVALLGKMMHKTSKLNKHL
jgi:hypothetical protein